MFKSYKFDDIESAYRINQRQFDEFMTKLDWERIQPLFIYMRRTMHIVRGNMAKSQ